MTDTVTIYHNPRCSKSRATLELLGAQGIQPRVIEYLDTPPDAATLDQLTEANASGRPKLLSRLKELGVARLPDRHGSPGNYLM